MTEEEEYTEHAEECLKLLEDHKFVKVGNGEFQVDNKFLHTILYTTTQHLLAENHSWIMINEDIMKRLNVPAIHHDNFVFAVNSLIGTILEQKPEILLLGRMGSENEKRVSTNAGQMVLAGYNELSKGIFTNMNAYK
jgi:hypothetical protein